MSFLDYASGWATIIGIVLGFFVLLEEVVQPEVKVEISKWLHNLQIEGLLSNWPAQFAALFDSIFGKRHLSWRCFVRSCIASLVSVVLAVFLFVLFLRIKIDKELLGLTPFVLFLAVIFNFIPDYLSLLESRYVIQWMSKHNSTIRILILIVFDLIATAIIWFVSAIIVLNVINYAINLYAGKDVERVLYSFMFFVSTAIVIFPLLCSAFFTSIWVWLYGTAGLVVKSVNKIGFCANLVKTFLNIEKRPLSSIGIVACMLISLGFLICLPFAL